MQQPEISIHPLIGRLRKRGHDRRYSFGKHGLPSARRADKQDVVKSADCNLSSSSGTLLTTDFPEIHQTLFYLVLL